MFILTDFIWMIESTPSVRPRKRQTSKIRQPHLRLPYFWKWYTPIDGILVHATSKCETLLVVIGSNGRPRDDKNGWSDWDDALLNNLNKHNNRHTKPVVHDPNFYQLAQANGQFDFGVSSCWIRVLTCIGIFFWHEIPHRIGKPQTSPPAPVSPAWK